MAKSTLILFDFKPGFVVNHFLLTMEYRSSDNSIQLLWKQKNLSGEFWLIGWVLILVFLGLVWFFNGENSTSCHQEKHFVL